MAAVGSMEEKMLVRQKSSRLNAMGRTHFEDRETAVLRREGTISILTQRSARSVDYGYTEVGDDEHITLEEQAAVDLHAQVEALAEEEEEIVISVDDLPPYPSTPAAPQPTKQEHAPSATYGSDARFFEDRGSNYFYANKLFVLMINMALLACNAADVFGSQEDIRTVAHILLSNLLVCAFMRNELYVNGLYWCVTRTPHYVPLSIRKRLARWVYSHGGYHSGAGKGVAMWLVYLMVLLTKAAIDANGSAKPMSNASALWVGKEGRLFTACALSYILFVLVTALIRSALLWRGTYHNLFETTHRWFGWTSLALTWAIVALFNGSDWSAPGYWLMCVSTILVAVPWTQVRKLPVTCVKPSSHAILIEFNDAAPIPGTFGRVAHHPIGEYHTFATITPNKHEKRHYMIIAGAGDWTKDLIAHPPEHLWARGIRTPGFMNTIKMFKRTVLVATGAGIAPCLPFMFAKEEWQQVVHLIWATKNPRVTFGDLICDAVEAMPSKTIWDSAVQGRAHVEDLAITWCQKLNAEAVHIVANEPMTIKCVAACSRLGLNCYGAIWDS